MAYVKSDSHDGRYYKFTVTQSGTSTKVNWKFESIGGSSAYYGSTAVKCIIDEHTVKSYDAKSYSNHTLPVITGSTSGTYDVGSYGKVKFTLSGRPYYASATSHSDYVTLTAPTYTIKFIDGGISNGTKKYDVTYTLPAPAARTGFIFQGWKDSGGTLRAVGYKYTKNAAATFTAVWLAATWTLAFNGGLGTLSNPTLTLPVTYGTTTNNSIAGKQSSSKELGYTLNNWVVGSTPIYDNLGNFIPGKFWTSAGKFDYISSTSKLTVTANWVPNTYKVSFYTCPTTTGTFVVTSTKSVQYQTNIPFDNDSVQIPPGYKFTGYWTPIESDAIMAYADTTLPDSAITSATLDSPGDIAYYAVYKDITPSVIELQGSGHIPLDVGISLSSYCDNVMNDITLEKDPNGSQFGYFRFKTTNNTPCRFDESSVSVICKDHNGNIISQTESLIKYYDTVSEALIAFKINYDDIEDTYYISIDGLKDALEKPVSGILEINIIPAKLLVDMNATRITVGHGKVSPDDGIEAITSYMPIVLRDDTGSSFGREIIQVIDSSFNLIDLLKYGAAEYFLPYYGDPITMIYGPNPGGSQEYEFNSPALLEVIDGSLVRVREGIQDFSIEGLPSLENKEFYVALSATYPNINFIKYPGYIPLPHTHLMDNIIDAPSGEVLVGTVDASTVSADSWVDKTGTTITLSPGTWVIKAYTYFRSKSTGTGSTDASAGYRDCRLYTTTGSMYGTTVKAYAGSGETAYLQTTAIRKFTTDTNVWIQVYSSTQVGLDNARIEAVRVR